MNEPHDRHVVPLSAPSLVAIRVNKLDLRSLSIHGAQIHTVDAALIALLLVINTQNTFTMLFSTVSSIDSTCLPAFILSHPRVSAHHCYCSRW